MAAKRKTKELSKTAAKKRRPVKETVRKKLAKKNATPKKKLAKKRPSLKKAAVKTRAGKKKAVAKAAGAASKRAQTENRSLDAEAFALHGSRARSAGQSGDEQGLSSVKSADSESVHELIEEGNAFEADIVAGVERAGDADEEEVHTHEVPEDDVPGEYLDEE